MGFPAELAARRPGQVVWVDLNPTTGQEQSGRRPAVVVSSPTHLRAATTLVTVLPCTTTDRGWRNHIQLTGDTWLDRPTFAMTEQVRTVSRDRVHAGGGSVNAECLRLMSSWAHHWISPGGTAVRAQATRA